MSCVEGTSCTELGSQSEGQTPESPGHPQRLAHSLLGCPICAPLPRHHHCAPFKGSQCRVLGLGSLKTDPSPPSPPTAPPTSSWLPESTAPTLVTGLSSAPDPCPRCFPRSQGRGGGQAIFWGEV